MPTLPKIKGSGPVCCGRRVNVGAMQPQPPVTIMRGLLARTSDYGPGEPAGRTARYAQVIYLAAPPARPVVTRAVAALPGALHSRVVVRDLPGEAAL